MGITISKPPINLREELTELKAQQGYEERQFHFDNLVTNGTFDTDTDWTKGTVGTVTIAGGVVNATNVTTIVEQETSMISGRTYVATFDYTESSSQRFRIEGNGNLSISQVISGTGSGTLSLPFVANDPTFRLAAEAAVFTGTIDNVSVYPSDGTDVAFTMPKGWKPLHVYDDGVLQREGSAEDYEVTFDGFN